VIYFSENYEPRRLSLFYCSLKSRDRPKAPHPAAFPVEGIGVYKPHPKVYQLAVDWLGIPASAISFQSSNAWDAYAASAFGMQVVWCNRYGQRHERLPGSPDREIQSLTEFTALVGAT